MTKNEGIFIQGYRLDSLTGFRFIAALMVFLWHTQLLTFLQLGYAGVGFFYILSGFILTHVYSTKLGFGSVNQKEVKKFYIARIAKLYPVHLLTFLISIPLFIPLVSGFFPVHTTLTTGAVGILNIGLLQSWLPAHSVNFSFNGVAWSISVEAFFYLLFPIFIILITKYQRMLSAKVTILIMGIIWLSLTAMYLLLFKDAQIDEWKIYILPLSRLPDFLMGILLYNVYSKSGILSGVKESVNNNATLLQILSTMLILIAIVTSILVPQSLRFSLWLMPFWLFLIYTFSFESGMLAKVFSHKILVFLGEISFSFYMIHQLVIRYVMHLSAPPVISICISLILSVGLSSVLYIYYEEPMRVKVKHLLEKVPSLRLRKKKASTTFIPTVEMVNTEE